MLLQQLGIVLPGKLGRFHLGNKQYARFVLSTAVCYQSITFGMRMRHAITSNFLQAFFCMGP